MQVLKINPTELKTTVLVYRKNCHKMLMKLKPLWLKDFHVFYKIFSSGRIPILIQVGKMLDSN